FNLGRHEDSLVVSLRCLGLDPGAARCKLIEANALMKLGRVDEAHEAHREARVLAGLP
ncbi:MAG: Flp pilus assembly protein TadD, partial [Myxococcota bacterium]